MEIKRAFSYVTDLIRIGVTGKLVYDFQEFKMLWRENLKTFSQRAVSSDVYEDILVSVIVPTRNEEKHLPRLLRSLRASWHRNIEVIVADYRSEDRTKEIANRYGAKVINVEKPGVGYASFVATQYAKGDIIIRTDADTVIPPHVIFNTVRMFKDNRKIVVYHTGHFYYDGNVVDNSMAFLYDKYWRKPWNTTGHFIAFRREVLNKVNFNPSLRYDDDWDFGERVKRAYGDQAFLFNRYDTIFTSSRRIKKTGRLKYILGVRSR